MRSQRARNKLTALAIANSKPRCLLSDGGGLYLQVTRGTDGKPKRSWLFRFGLPGGRVREMGLGSLLDVALPEARELATKARKALRDGVDPIEEKRARKALLSARCSSNPSFKECAERFVAANQSAWRAGKYRDQWIAPVSRYAYPTIGSLPVAAVNVQHVTKILEPLWSTRTETARRLRMRLEAVLDWAAVMGHRSGDNPARWKGHLDKVFPAPSKVTPVQHHPALPYQELPEFMRELHLRDGIGAIAFRFLILTAARTSEVLGARWGEIDQKAWIWVVPAQRMKSGRAHRVPLAPACRDLLLELGPRTANDYIFEGASSGGRLSSMVFLMTLRRMGREDLTAHGFRSSFRDWAAECTKSPREVAEAALAHVIGDQTEAAYRRGDLFEKRLRLMKAWAGYCCSKSHDIPKAA